MPLLSKIIRNFQNFFVRKHPVKSYYLGNISIKVHWKEVYCSISLYYSISRIKNIMATAADNRHERPRRQSIIRMEKRRHLELVNVKHYLIIIGFRILKHTVHEYLIQHWIIGLAVA